MPTTITGTDGVSQVQTGAVESGDLPAGSVIQVVEGLQGDYLQITTSSFVDMGLEATITPSSASNKIQVIVTVGVAATGGGQQGLAQLIRLTNGLNATNIGEPSQDVGNREKCFFSIRTATSNDSSSLTNSFIDSPNTTDELTYKIQVRSENADIFALNGTAVNNPSNFYPRTISHIILMEIAG